MTNNSSLTYIYINGIKREVKLSQTIMQACESYGIQIPHFCYHDRLSVAGNCRMCLVEETKSPKPLASCAINVMPNMNIYTNTALVKKAREGVMEFLLANHPLDCPICDQGGECDLQDQALVFGGDRGRFYEDKRSVEDKNFGPLVKTVMTRCIHCTRCVRYVREVAGLNSFGITGRGAKMEIGFYIKNSLNTEVSGNVIDLCPVGALTSKPYAFKARPWELSSHFSIDPFDSWGSNIRIDVLGTKVLRILPKINKFVNDNWISDKIRFAYDSFKTQRLVSPMLFDQQTSQFNKVSWNTAFNSLSKFLQGEALINVNLIASISKQGSLESCLSLLDFSNKLGKKLYLTNTIDLKTIDPSYRYNYFSNYLQLPALKRVDVVLLVGTNPRHEAPVLNIYLRKLQLSGAKIFSVGFNSDLNYSVTSLGTNLAVLDDIVLGKHFLCKHLVSAKNPLILVGSALCSSNPAVYNSLQTLSVNLRKYNKSLVESFIHILTATASETNLLELGSPSNDYYTLKSSRASANVLLSQDCLADANIIGTLKNTFAVQIGPHGTSHSTKYNLLLPSLLFTETSETYINLQGFVQKTKSIFFDIPLAKSVNQIFEELHKYLTGVNLYDTTIQTRLEAYLGFNPVKVTFPTRLSITPAFEKTRKFSLKPGNTSLADSHTQAAISNFYLDDSILQASKIMSLCSKHFTKIETTF